MRHAKKLVPFWPTSAHPFSGGRDMESRRLVAGTSILGPKEILSTWTSGMCTSGLLWLEEERCHRLGTEN